MLHLLANSYWQKARFQESRKIYWLVSKHLNNCSPLLFLQIALTFLYQGISRGEQDKEAQLKRALHAFNKYA